MKNSLLIIVCLLTITTNLKAQINCATQDNMQDQPSFGIENWGLTSR